MIFLLYIFVCLAGGEPGPSTPWSVQLVLICARGQVSLFFNAARITQRRARHQFLFLWYSNCVCATGVFMAKKLISRARKQRQNHMHKQAMLQKKISLMSGNRFASKRCWPGFLNFICGETNLLKRWELFHFYNCHKLIHHFKKKPKHYFAMPWSNFNHYPLWLSSFIQNLLLYFLNLNMR